MKNQDWTNRFTRDFGNGNGKVKQDMPLGGKITDAEVRVHGNLVLGVGGGNSGTVRFPEVLARLVNRIKVRVAKATNSRYPDGYVKDLDPRTILRRAMLYQGKYLGDLLGTAFVGANGTYAIDFHFPLYFSQPDLKRDIETALNGDPSAYKTITIEVETGNKDSVTANNDRTWDFSGLQIDFTDHREAIDGDTYVLVEEDHEVIIPGAKDRMLDELMPEDGALLDILVCAQTGLQSTSPVYSDAILERMVIQGQNFDQDLYAGDIRAAMFRRKEPGYLDIDQTATGFYHASFVRSGMITKTVPAAGLQVHYQVLNPSGANLDSLFVSTRRLYSPTGFTPIAFGQKGNNTSAAA